MSKLFKKCVFRFGAIQRYANPELLFVVFNVIQYCTVFKYNFFRNDVINLFFISIHQPNYWPFCTNGNFGSHYGFFLFTNAIDKLPHLKVYCSYI